MVFGGENKIILDKLAIFEKKGLTSGNVFGIIFAFP